MPTRGSNAVRPDGKELELNPPIFHDHLHPTKMKLPQSNSGRRVRRCLEVPLQTQNVGERIADQPPMQSNRWPIAVGFLSGGGCAGAMQPRALLYIFTDSTCLPRNGSVSSGPRSEVDEEEEEEGRDWVNFDVDKDVYREKLDEMHRVLIKHRGNDREVDGCPVLHWQNHRYKPPFRWLMLNLTGRDGNNSTLAIRQDNLYLLGFTNGTGQWFVFKDQPFKDKRRSVLSFGGGYPDLLGGHDGLTRIRLGRDATQWAIEQLSCYPTNDNGLIKEALVTLIATFSEASRFVTFLDKIEEGWKDGTTLNETEVKHVVQWYTISCALLCSQQNNIWGGTGAWEIEQKLQIKDRSTARGRLRLILWPYKDECPCGTGHHRGKGVPIQSLKEVKR